MKTDNTTTSETITLNGERIANYDALCELTGLSIEAVVVRVLERRAEDPADVAAAIDDICYSPPRPTRLLTGTEAAPVWRALKKAATAYAFEALYGHPNWASASASASLRRDQARLDYGVCAKLLPLAVDWGEQAVQHALSEMFPDTYQKEVAR